MNRPEWVSLLPDWAEYNENDGRVEVDPDVVYPLFLETNDVTQATLEVARLKFTKILRDEIVPEGEMLLLRILSKDYKWRLSNFPV